MTNMSEEEKIAWVVAAASQLRVGTVPQNDLWLGILERLQVQGTRRSRGFPWITFVIVVLLLLISGSIVSSKIAAYRSARTRAIAMSPEGFRERLYRADRMRTSDHDKATMLMTLVEPAGNDTSLVSAIIQVARPIDSSYEKARVLVKLAKNRALTTPSLRTAYISAAYTISSKAERENTLDALDQSPGPRPYFRPDELRPRR